ncbi:zinc metalloprotease HtpX [Listeria welshimeri]|uniref:zinc metalloprotease HtpX n=1 Tax=Listeria welshimeri TaxID=1643 RepID=UPI001628F5C1|nr:zinc metalloprotease HtpX [Listeria welshimeri]MBC1476264.1 zinc metalloprotease HtpX [Listeria welshimeri]MBC2008579.1 zinc metalloprotease HtpX [Listeria welshimeri]MBF2340567.1 zinc metalloprotease HtpX [Listeria welshimeri]MBF2379581.1 zinc metalloprotease HtpX [Listeria welshimeri]MBF2427790.1 zinc metalloprotease HtpX [Listeria welshimeri]
MLFEQIAANKRKTVFIVIGFFIFVLMVGAAIGIIVWNNYLNGLILAAVIGAFYILIMVMTSSSVVMAMNRAKRITSKEQAPVLWDTVESMAMVASIPMPKVYIMNDLSLNAFAAGISPEKGAVAVTQGLLDNLERYELEGVIAHEVSHIRNYDIRLSTISIALVAVIAILSDLAMRMIFWGSVTGSRNNRKNDNNNGGGAQLIIYIVALVFVVLAPIIATAIQFALSRNREYLADASAIELTRNPDGLIQALQKVSGDTKKMKEVSASSESIYFSSPLKSKKDKPGIFDSHPPISSRIERLENM